LTDPADDQPHRIKGKRLAGSVIRL